jgi:hypothetical protein
MKRMRTVAIAVLASGALACVALAQQQGLTRPPGFQRLQAVETSADSLQFGINVVKTIVTAEVAYSSKNVSFASWDDLYQSSDTQQFWQRLHISAGPEVVPGWTLNLVTSADGKHFQISLHNTASKCGLSVFSSDNGIIYEAGYVDCVQLVPSQQ